MNTWKTASQPNWSGSSQQKKQKKQNSRKQFLHSHKDKGQFTVESVGLIVLPHFNPLFNSFTVLFDLAKKRSCCVPWNSRESVARFAAALMNRLLLGWLLTLEYMCAWRKMWTRINLTGWRSDFTFQDFLVRLQRDDFFIFLFYRRTKDND